MLRIGVKLAPGITGFGEFAADVSAIEASGAHSIWLAAEPAPGVDALMTLGALTAITRRVGLGLIAATAPSRELERALEALQAMSGGRALGAIQSGARLRVAAGMWPGPAAEVESWEETDAGQSRADWRQALDRQEEAGRAGVIVAWSPRIVDLLRNSDLEDDRSDLQMSTG
ncbi:MAG TPA: hypothetical protein VKT20_07220 [Candidatus Dormibacteraeota bacterium]|nr:hypothetical protein [Candidatus Dormibacteraeota bacterium]